MLYNIAMKWFLAHAGEKHEAIIESTSHTFGVDPIAAVVFAFLLAILVVASLQLFVKNIIVTVIAALACLFLIGVFSYHTAPVVGALCIVFGFVLSFLLVFVGLVKD